MRKRSDGERNEFQPQRPGRPQRHNLLYEVSARDEWQSSLITCDGCSGGVVVRKVVEPATYMVRYLVVYRTDEDRHLLVPASTVLGGDLGEIHCTLSGGELEGLPSYKSPEITRSDEMAVYQCLGHTPYWVEEHGYHLDRDRT